MLARQNLLPVLPEPLPQLRLADVADPVQQRLHGLVLAEQAARGLLPHPGHAGDVVGRVALQALQIRDLLRGDPESLPHCRLIVDRGLRDAARGHHHARVGRDQLERIQIPRHDQDVDPLRLRLPGQRADDVIGLEPGHLEDRQLQRLNHLFGQAHLGAEIVRHLAPGGLVLRVGFVAEGRPGPVEGHGHVLGRLILQHLEQHRGETVHGVGRLAVARREVWKGVKGPVDETVGVDENEERAAGASRHRSTIIARAGRRSAAPRARRGCDTRGAQRPRTGIGRRWRLTIAPAHAGGALNSAEAHGASRIDPSDYRLVS